MRRQGFCVPPRVNQTVGRQVSFQSAATGMTLEPGDVIGTGTPDGVGFTRKPPVFMAAGDIVEVEIEGVGLLRNRIEDEPESAAHA
ncbi:MAG: fumarylacetoacetate hydrolase family protein [Rhodanobacteraceae bacterium]